MVKLRNIYIDAMDFGKVNAKRQEILEEILKLAKIRD